MSPNEAMRLAFEFNAQNLFNQHAAMSYLPNPFGRNNQWLTFSGAANALGTDGAGRDDPEQPLWPAVPFQPSRTLRLGVRFTF